MPGKPRFYGPGIFQRFDLINYRYLTLAYLRNMITLIIYCTRKITGAHIHKRALWAEYRIGTEKYIIIPKKT